MKDFICDTIIWILLIGFVVEGRRSARKYEEDEEKRLRNKG